MARARRPRHHAARTTCAGTSPTSSGSTSARIAVIPNGIDPPTCSPSTTSTRCARASPRRDERLVLLVGRLVYEKGFQLALDALPRRDRARSATCASSSPARARPRPSCKARPSALGLLGARHVPGLDRRRRPALALPDRRPLRRAVASTSRSASSRWRRWPAAARASSPTPAACARSCPNADVGLRFRSRDPRALARDDRAGARPTTRCATGSSPRPPSTCCASTGPTSRARRPRVYRGLRAGAPTTTAAAGTASRTSA